MEFNADLFKAGPQSLFERATANLSKAISAPTRKAGVGVVLSDLKIRTKERELIPFTPNVVQHKYLDLLQPGWTQDTIRLAGVRDIILKARQEGITTLFCMLYLMDTLNQPYTHTVVIGNDAENTEKIFQMVQRAFNALPADKRPHSKHASKREFYWPEIDSSYYVGTAGDRDFGRGLTVNNVHCTEVATWPDAKSILSGLLQAVPASGNACLETTAKGVGNYYHTEYELAQEGESNFTPRFFGWPELPEYQTQPPPGWAPTEDEIAYGKVWNLSLEQLCWRRGKVKELKGDMPQEYPICPEEAFLSTGHHYFNNEKLVELRNECPTELPIQKVHKTLATLRRKELIIYEPPKKGRMYVLGADTAEGIDDEGNHDYCSADVLDFETLEQVAHLHGRWDTHDYGIMLANLGKWFNMAWLIVERNNHGHAVLNSILHSTDYPRMTPEDPYHGLYYHREFDQTKRMRVRRPGWPSNVQTKFFALDALASWVEEEEIGLNNRASIREMMNYVKLPGGKAEAQKGQKDDRVISLAVIAGAMAQRRKPSAPKSSKTVKAGGWA